MLLRASGIQLPVSGIQEEVRMSSSTTGTPEADQLPHPLVQLARATIEKYVREGKWLKPTEAPALIEGGPAGVFVTIHKASTGELRGCIGTIEPTEPQLAQETINNAVAAATRDPRFPPIGPRELNDLVIDVSVLYPPEPIDSVDQLDPRRYGVIVQSLGQGSHRSGRRGLLLPDIPGIDDVETQVAHARQKAWIGADEPVQLFRFRVEKYT
jgi:AmmeMemoRadiSam system protein A